MGQSAAEGVHGFPAALTSFVGRAEAIGEVAGLLERHRLVTVTGPGGAGKTRLAGQVAARVAARFADGVWLAELAAVRDPAQVPAVVAAALGVRDLPGAEPSDGLAQALARREMLLVLDNCEHVIGAAAVLSAGLLAACDDLRILATSREPLRIAGEARYRLGPLSLPDPGHPADADRSEAVALFADRARRADARFALDRQTGPGVARLVARLDGMPLAIELAAAQVEVLGVAQLLERIDDRFGLLVAGDRLAAGRQRSLAAAVEWSYQLLDERERRVFRAVSAFPGPFTLEGAEAVAGAGTGPAVLRLVDCSLLSPPRVGPDGRSRYVMLETLRAYGAGLLAAAAEDKLAAAALARYVWQLVEEAAAGLSTDTGEAAGARHLDAEDATVRHALAWAAEHDPAMALRFALALTWWWLLRGRLTSQVPLLAAAADTAAVGSRTWCAARIWLGRASLYSADPAAALGHFTAVRDAIGDRGPSHVLAVSLAARSSTLLYLGRAAEAADDGRRSVALARETGYPDIEVLALVFLAVAAALTGDQDQAARLASQAQQIEAEIPAATARLFRHLLAVVLTEVGDLAAAEQACAAGLAASREVGDVWNLAGLLIDMAFLNLRAGRAADAAAHLREQLQLAMRSGFREDLLDGLNCCGYLCAATGRSAETVTLWAAFTALRQQEGWISDVRPAHREGPWREARKALGAEGARVAEERGAAMSLATASDYALMLAVADPRPGAAPDGPGRLSARERELITLVARGRTDAQIAAQLYISVRTVGSHLDRIRDKTGCRRRADLTRLALSAGLV